MVKKDKHIRPGYHLTEVGIIPVDWEVKKLWDLFEFKNWLNKEKWAFWSWTPIVNYMDVYKNRWILSGDIKWKVTLSNEEIKNYEARKWDVFFTRTSETVEEVGYSSVLLEDIEKATFSGFVLRGRPKTNELVPEYEQYCFSTRSFRKDVIASSTYTTRALTNWTSLSKIKILVPKKPEQSAIAKVLSDTDALISSLDELIEKKKSIKQGTMQELLTGKRRLPGFSGKWENVEIGNILNIQKWEQLNRSKLLQKWDYPAWNGWVEPSWYTNMWNIEWGTITISEWGNSCGFIGYIKTKFWLGWHCYALTNLTQRVNEQFLYQLLKLKEKKIMSLRIGSGLPNIQKKNLLEYLIKIPIDITEQIAIATIFSDMDFEISELEKKRDKYKQIKQGMMTELLTGNIRLLWVK